MSIALRRSIEQSPAGTLFTREGLLAAWNQDAGAAATRWVGVSEAREITGIPRSTLRGSASRWWEMQEQGQQPPIRVRRKGPSARSPWLFDEGDCWTYRRENGGGPRTEEATQPPPAAAGRELDERAATVAHWAERLSANV
jgi:hypothetical protein